MGFRQSWKTQSTWVATILGCCILVGVGCNKSLRDFSPFQTNAKDTSTAIEELENSLSESRPMTGETKIWYTSFDEAMRESARTGKPVLADFTGSDWCHWCVKLKKDVFQKQEFLDWASQNAVLLELDYPKRTPQDAALRRQNEKLLDRYEISGYPTVLMLDSQGNVLGKLGYMPTAKDWIKSAQQKLEQADRAVIAKGNSTDTLGR
jgi:protein disulfide-isomerase